MDVWECSLEAHSLHSFVRRYLQQMSSRESLHEDVISKNTFPSRACSCAAYQAGFPCTHFRRRVSAKEKMYFHVCGIRLVVARHFQSLQGQGRGHARCIGMGNARAEKSLIERRFRAPVKYPQADTRSWKW